MSMHAYAGTDPVMKRMAEMARAEASEEAGQACFDCHSPAAVRNDELRALGHTGPFEDLADDGVNCDVCHSVAIVPPVGDIDFLKEVDPTGPKRGGLRDPAPNEAHESLFDSSFTTSIQCAPCHQLALSNGTEVENTFQEWEDSILSGQGIECQTCHMPRYRGAAVPGLAERDDLHRHFMTGVDYALEPFRGIDRDEQLAQIRGLLENSVQVDVLGLPATVSAGDSLTLEVQVTNDRTGHSIPSGTSFRREMWISVSVTDASGSNVGHSGALEENGDLEVDDQLSFFGARLLDGSGEPTFFTWRAQSIDESGLLRAGQSRLSRYRFDVPGGASGPLRVVVTLRFRPIPPSLLREIELPQFLPVEIFDMWHQEFEVTLTP